MKIEQEFDATQREIVIDIARLLYRNHHGCTLPRDPLYLWKSQHPTERVVLATSAQVSESPLA
jgi:hypothetical protein